MPKRQKQIPSKGVSSALPPTGILELDRFSEASLRQWEAISSDLDLLQDELYFGTEPERRKLRPELIAALQSCPTKEVRMTRWSRIVSYKYSLMPLSCAGSLQSVGGRFNAGAELNANTLNPWPALYIAEDFATAFREKFQLRQTESVEGLTPQELALEQGVSHTTLFVQGRLTRVFDMTSVGAFDALAKVLKRVTLPAKAKQLRSKLAIPNRGLFMVTTSHHIHDVVLKQNWRVLPMQFGLPAQSQVLAELIRASGFEAILYASTKGAGKCLAVFPDLLAEGSYVELSDPAPPEVAHTQLSLDSADALAGWESLPRRMRNL